MLYFGAAWDAPAIDDATATDTPVGVCCAFCPQSIVAGDRGFILPHAGAEQPGVTFHRPDSGGVPLSAIHRWCLLANTAGREMADAAFPGEAPPEGD